MGRPAARLEGRHRAVGEGHFRKSLVGVAAGIERFKLRFRQVTDEVEIVNHQIKDDRHVLAAARRRGAAHAVDLQGRIAAFKEADFSGHVTLLMADLKDQRPGVGERDQLVRVFRRQRDGLFNEHMAPGFKRGARKIIMGHGRGRDDQRIDAVQKRAFVVEDAGPEPVRQGFGAIGMTIQNADQYRIVGSGVF